MKNENTSIAITALLLLLGAGAVHAQTTAFTYQGRLTDGGNPANGNYDLQFYLRDAAVAGSPVGTTNTLAPVPVTNGLFAVVLDFNAAPFVSGANRWLEIGVRSNGSVGPYAILAPRQQITSTPYAITAGNFTGTLPASQLTGTLPSGLLSGTYSGGLTFNNGHNSFAGDGSGLFNLNADLLGGLTAGQFWQLTGNAGTTAGVNYLGTPDNQALELKVNNARALRIEPDPTFAVPNIIGGSRANFVRAGSIGNVIGGGGYTASDGTNYITGVNFNTVGGGYGNQITNLSTYDATIAGGEYNTVSARDGVIGGGNNNTVTGTGGTVSGGANNFARGSYAMIAGGINNLVLGDYGFAGGFGNTVSTNCVGSAIISGMQNAILLDIGFACSNSVIGGGYSNRILLDSHYCTIGGGFQNLIVDTCAGSFIGGGTGNRIGMSFNATIAGGKVNAINTQAERSFIGGGQGNTIGGSASESVIVGGFSNQMAGLGHRCVIGGGEWNKVLLDIWSATVSGGTSNTLGGNNATIPGGLLNSALGTCSFAAGKRAKANHDGAFVWADSQNADFATTAANQFLIRAADGVSIGAAGPLLDSGNLINLQVGASNTNGAANGISFVEFAGFSMKLGYNGAGNGSDNKLVIYDTDDAERFVFENGGNLGLGVSNPANPIQHSSGAILTAAGVWQSVSDVHRKTAFAPVNPQDVLTRLAALPVQSWRYTNELTSVRHLGPTAQDFKAAFGLGTDDKSIGMIDADGVALAAIQGLNQKVEEKEARIRELEKSVNELKELVRELAAGKNVAAR